MNLAARSQWWGTVRALGPGGVRGQLLPTAPWARDAPQGVGVHPCRGRRGERLPDAPGGQRLHGADRRARVPAFARGALGGGAGVVGRGVGGRRGARRRHARGGDGGNAPAAGQRGQPYLPGAPPAGRHPRGLFVCASQTHTPAAFSTLSRAAPTAPTSLRACRALPPTPLRHGRTPTPSSPPSTRQPPRRVSRMQL